MPFGSVMSNNNLISPSQGRWQFWIDRGGTFTDIVAKDPAGTLHTKKLLSENPEAYADAALQGIREFLGIDKHDPIPAEQVKVVKMGTTVATNALLEKKGESTVLAITAGLGDILEIGHQARPNIFALNITKSPLLYCDVIEITERVLANGDVETPLDDTQARQAFKQAYDKGYRSIAIVLMHAYRFPEHEQTLALIAKEIGFTQISTSHDVSPLTKIVPRGETTVVDAYLTPILRKYVDRIESAISNDNEQGKLLFMQSSGGLTDASKFRGRDAILSGPAGGIVGAVHTAKLAGFTKMIGFDMGGTSTDVSHYAGEYEKVYETEVAGVRMRVPMMFIHTVAAGGGSVLSFDGSRFRVGPDSAGANPGPKCYRRGGLLAVTDINVCLGKVQPDFFPHIFGPNQDQALDQQAAFDAFVDIANEVADGRSAEQVAQGFLDITIEHMAQAIKKISVARGYNLAQYVLNCFGGAGGQHACLVAERLGMDKVFLHPFSGVLSAYGMGLADISVERQIVLEQVLSATMMAELQDSIDELTAANVSELIEQGLAADETTHTAWAQLRYKGTDTSLKVLCADHELMREEFEHNHKRQYGFIMLDKAIIVEMAGVLSSGGGEGIAEAKASHKTTASPEHIALKPMYSKGAWHQTPVYNSAQLSYGHLITGPAIIIEPTGTIIVEQDWQAEVTQYGHIILSHINQAQTGAALAVKSDPVTLEIYNNLFMSIAQQMGFVLQNTAQSVNIKERLDFSCAIFDKTGSLVANAPHVPVHLGSMDSSVKVIINSGQTINPGDVFVQNNPYNGGSHLPDITVITPVFDADNKQVLFYVASRAHHEDIGGIAPGSMSSLAKTIYEEGIVLDSIKLVDQGVFLHDVIQQKLSEGPYPARNIEQNIADLMAQIAANNTGVNELLKLVDTNGIESVHAYMGYIQDSAEEAVRQAITSLKGGQFTYKIDSGAVIQVAITVDKNNRSATIDFSGTSSQQPSNFNAPQAITHAAVLYVFRCLVNDDIPLNAGCMKPLNVIVPSGSMLNPEFPAAVVAGNVETSQAVTNALFAALGALGTSQGTMNNLTFGNAKYQYYETICSGSPAGNGFNGTAAVHTHMTNTRMTDPEIMEQRYPVVLDEFSIRRGSGGKGKWDAGDGIYRKIRFNDTMVCSILSDHRVTPPVGVLGGEDGQLGRNWVTRKDGSIVELGGCGQAEVHCGDAVNVISPTGGGFGKR